MLFLTSNSYTFDRFLLLFTFVECNSVRGAGLTNASPPVNINTYNKLEEIGVSTLKILRNIRNSVI